MVSHGGVFYMLTNSRGRWENCTGGKLAASSARRPVSGGRASWPGCSVEPSARKARCWPRPLSTPRQKPPGVSVH